MIQRIRDISLLLGGMALLAYETVGVPEPRPLILSIAVAMLGLPASLITGRTFVKSTTKDPEQIEKT